MPDQDRLRVTLFESVEHGVPIVDSRIERVMGHEKYRLFTVRHGGQDRIEPPEILGGEMAIPHFHNRSLVQADEPEPSVIKNKPVVAEQAGKR